ncbi:hypothetical protein J3A64_001859 [Pseudarthrobacter sp. PvP004]|uniref:caspase family protein n=1 Tax=Pseudarthrobacter sp. PvP004 TaxID=2817850 RepID=UPI001AE16D33|nr:hypothetical protein [Pseudarthrobacter sp. PvP004]
MDECRALAKDIEIQKATEEAIHSFLFRELPKISNDFLIFYWGGHGLMDNDQNRVLFTADANESYMANLQLSGFLSDLRTDQYQGSRMQHVIVDACANFEDLSMLLNSLPQRIGSRGQQQPSINQFAIFAADRGERAHNDSNAGTGYFSKIFFDVLSSQENMWPVDLTEVFKIAHTRMQSLMETRLGRQTVVCIDYSAPGLGTIRKWVESNEARQMISRISDTEVTVDSNPSDVRVLTDGHMQQFFLRSRMALEDAGRVPGVEMEDGGSAFAGGLYVRRDLEVPLVTALRDPGMSPLLVTGKPGAGKTSLLWGLGSTLATEPGASVLFIRAPWMLRGPDQAPFSSDVVVETARVLAAEGKKVSVLIDTADTLVADEQGHATLVFLVESLAYAGHSVVVTSRPEEAKLLPHGWNRRLLGGLSTDLGDYSQDVPSVGGTSEFERAVASHAKMFRVNYGARIDVLIHQLVNTVARRQSMAMLCLRPLFLKMLFQLYAPNSVPEDLSVTGLYQKYWLDRVQQDRRDQVSASSVKGSDLSETGRLIGLEMLRQGSPEINLGSVALPSTTSSDQFVRDVEAMVARGVGEIRAGTFRFFHQTFFEFAAAQGLIESGGHVGLQVLIERARTHSGDYFLLAVLEQTWLCAWHSAETRLPAMREAEALLSDLRQVLVPSATADEVPEGTKLPVSLQQTVMRVVAQVPVGSSKLVGLFESIIAHGAVDLARQALRLLPTPGRIVGAIEAKAIVASARRWDKGRSPAIEAFGRVAESSPRIAVNMLPELAIVPEDVYGANSEAKYHIDPRLTQIIIGLLPTDPERVLAALERIVGHAKTSRRPAVAADVFNGLAVFDGELTEIVVEWCSRVGAGLTVAAEVRTSLALIHRNEARMLIGSEGWSEASRLIMQPLVQARGSDVPTRDLDLTVGVLLAIDETTPESVVEQILQLLLQVESPEVHAEFHHGVLVPLLQVARGDNRNAIVSALAEGLPVPKRDVSGLPGRWADTLRRTLERSECPSSTAAAIGELAVSALGTHLHKSETSLWLDPDVLLTVVIKAAAGGGTTAQAALKAAVAGEVRIADAGRRYLSQRARSPEGAEEEASVVVSLILMLRDNQAMLHLVQLHSLRPFELSSEDRALLESNVNESLASSSGPARSLAARLFSAAVVAGLLAFPSVEDERLRLRPGQGAPNLAAIEVLTHGFNTGRYTPGEVRLLLDPFLAVSAGSHVSSDSLAVREAKRLDVKIFAATCKAEDWPLLVEKVFQAEADTKRAINASSFITDRHRLMPGPTVAEKAAFMIGFGKRLALSNPTSAMSKDVANAWLPTIRAVVRDGGRSAHVALLEALTTMESRFAGEVAGSLNLVVHRDLLGLANRVLDLKELTPHVRERLATVVRDAALLSASSAWAEMDDDLADWRNPRVERQNVE